MNILNKKGFAGIFIGFGTLLLILLVVYILLSILNPPMGDQVVYELGQLRNATVGLN